MKTIVVGAVAYTANVVPIWDGLRDYFHGEGVDMDYVLFSNYERQVDALLAGQIAVAWNTNLAWVRTVGLTQGRCRALAMRDIDLSFRSIFVRRPGEPIARLEDLRGCRLALGSRDSAQAAILPLHFLTDAGLASDVTILRFDRDSGKHGDTGRSELDALRAVLEGDAEAAAIGVTTWRSIGRDDLMHGTVEAFWESPAYCHCNFSVTDLDRERAAAWMQALLAMDWENPDHRRLMEMEGLQRRWVPARVEGYASLFAAVREQEIPLRW